MSGTSTRIVIPGDLVCSKDDGKTGKGVYAYQKQEIRASVVGHIVSEKKEKTGVEETGEDAGKSSKPRINVLPPQHKRLAKEYVVNVGDVIYGRVVRTNYNQAYVDVLCIGDTELPFPLKGVIRREDIRETEIDKVVVHEFFRSLDIVRASVISLGDSKYYFLTTAKPDLGVVLPRGKDKFI